MSSLPPSELTSASSSVPYRQIRADYDNDTITVYQAYSSSIAIPAVRDQKLTASSDFHMGRMTWIKPSWCWMMYRSGYSTKDPRQAHILALKIPHKYFKELLSQASVTSGHGGPLTSEQRSKPVRVQWDPERGPSLQVLPYRSIQIGISGGEELKRQWAEEWIVAIEDVTEKAKALMAAVQESQKAGQTLTVDEATQRGLMPVERKYEVDDDLREVLKMDVRDSV